MWQSLQESAKDHGFTVLAIALDEPDAARPWIEAAAPTFPCLIDREHRVAELYNLVNVPQAVWIDETGRMVRPPESAGSTLPLSGATPAGRWCMTKRSGCGCWEKAPPGAPMP